MHLVFGFGERFLHRLPDGVDFQHAHGGDKNLDERRRRVPQRRERPDLSIAVGMKHALVPAPRTLRIIRILPNDIQEG